MVKRRNCAVAGCLEQLFQPFIQSLVAHNQHDQRSLTSSGKAHSAKKISLISVHTSRVFCLETRTRKKKHDAIPHTICAWKCSSNRPTRKGQEDQTFSSAVSALTPRLKKNTLLPQISAKWEQMTVTAFGGESCSTCLGKIQDPELIGRMTGRERSFRWD